MAITPRFGPKETTQEQPLGTGVPNGRIECEPGSQTEPFRRAANQRYIKRELSLAEENAQLEAYYPVSQGN